MSSLIEFSDAEYVDVQNSSFHIIHDFLVSSSAHQRVAKRIVEDNPIADAIGLLDLASLEVSQLIEFRWLLDILRARSPEISASWNRPEYLERFLCELTGVQQAAERAFEAKSQAPGPDSSPVL